MKIRQVDIQYFKGIEHESLKFYDEYTGRINPVTAIFGDNASGKTSVLQAIALTVSMATKKTSNLEYFQWHGFLADRLDPRANIVVQLELSEQELTFVHELYAKWKGMQPADRYMAAPGQDRFITLEYKNGQVWAHGGEQNKYALFGRYYIKQLLKLKAASRTQFDRVGDIFWFDQYRNLGQGVHALDAMGESSEHEKALSQITWKAGIEGLRKELVGWWYRRKNFPQFDLQYLDKLEERFARVFPGVRFEGAQPMDELSIEHQDHYFLLSRLGVSGTRNMYDFSEMSSGEQNIFSLLYQFIRMHVAHSVVLIDELELHLHPPEQQALYSSLKHFADDCQYIFTSHSPYLSEAVPDEFAHRMKGGKLWL